MSKEKEIKTNAMRILDKEKIHYQVYTYENDGTCVDGETVARLIGKDINQTFKTLITTANHEYYVFVLPSSHELDLKKAAKVVSVKSLEMIHVKDITAVSGYVRGGCSPFGMKKQFVTTFDESAQNFETIVFSGGKIGVQLEVKVEDLKKFPKFSFADIVK